MLKGKLVKLGSLYEPLWARKGKDRKIIDSNNNNIHNTDDDNCNHNDSTNLNKIGDRHSESYHYYFFCKFPWRLKTWHTSWHEFLFMSFLGLHCEQYFLIQRGQMGRELFRSKCINGKETFETESRLHVKRKCANLQINMEGSPTGAMTPNLFMFLIYINVTNRETSCKYVKFTETQYWREY